MIESEIFITFFHGSLHLVDGVFRYFELEGVSFEEPGDAVDQESFDLVLPDLDIFG